jgi:hypothetical protein
MAKRSDVLVTHVDLAVIIYRLAACSIHSVLALIQLASIVLCPKSDGSDHRAEV